ncbi:MAG: helix-turn-helix transcriptional regulator [Prevotellaceae bacterium]|jgi:DNA-binding XRE family transcriptional regulator|nr:helix-turn-helix transcriptional regulator [Prevotellaceae bacterium]
MNMNEKKIKNLRKKLGFSQKKMAEILGVHTRTIQNWEKGGVIPTVKHAILYNMGLEEGSKKNNLNEQTAVQPPESETVSILRSLLKEAQEKTVHLSVENALLQKEVERHKKIIRELERNSGDGKHSIIPHTELPTPMPELPAYMGIKKEGNLRKSKIDINQ